MKYNSSIDNVTALKWGLNLQQAVLFDWITTLPTWADKIVRDNGDVLYMASKNLACKELPLLTDKPDTMYRYYKQLESHGLIKIEKIKGADYLLLTDKCSQWGRGELGKISEQTRKNIREDSDLNPTYNNTINNNTIDNIVPTLEEFIEHARKRKPNVDTAVVEGKYWAWHDNGWHTLGDKSRKIKNWKSTLNNSLPYMPEKKKETTVKPSWMR